MSDKIKLYGVLTWHDEHGRHYQAYSLYNEWKGAEHDREDDAIANGERHQMALEYLLKGKDDTNAGSDS